MNCPHCASATTKEQTKRTSLSYRTFRCPNCKQSFNEHTGTPFNFDELRNYLRPRFTLGKSATLSELRRAFLDRLTALKKAIRAAS